MNKNRIFSKVWFLALLLVTFVAGCGGNGSNDNNGNDQTTSSAKALSTYSLDGASGIINESAKTVAVTVPYGTDVKALIATFTTTGSGVKIGTAAQTSGTTTNNFTDPVPYVITAADNTTATYTVTVTVAQITAKAITTFTLAGVAGAINETAKSIAVTLPNSTGVTALAATFTTTGKSVKVGAALQKSGITANNFTTPVAYTITAADDSTTTYSVTVTVASVSAKALTAFSLDGTPGVLNETLKTITVALPNGKNTTALVATFATTGASVKVGTALQTSGSTPNNFTTPVVYTVTAANATTAEYTVTVTVAANSAKAITAFSLAGVAGAINEQNKVIAVNMANGTDVKALVATFATTGAHVKVGTTEQISGTTATNFTNPVAYIVTAADSTTTTYTVTVTLEAAKGPAPVLLGAAGNYAILATSGVSTVPASVITGDIGLSPAATSYLTGFSLTMVGTTAALSPQVTGTLYAADMSPPTSSNLTTAVANMGTAYTDAAGRPTPDFLNLGTGEIGGSTLLPGLYKWTTGVTISSDVTFSGGPNDVWIMQIPGTLMISPAKKVFLSGGAQAKNIFWQVAQTASISLNAHFEGIILSQTSIILETGASMNGRALAQMAVELGKSTVTAP
jgi:hypothetical protein